MDVKLLQIKSYTCLAIQQFLYEAEGLMKIYAS